MELAASIIPSVYSDAVEQYRGLDQVKAAVLGMLESYSQRVALDIGFGVRNELGIREELRKLPPGTVVASDGACTVLRGQLKIGFTRVFSVDDVQFHYVVGWTEVAQEAESQVAPERPASQGWLNTLEATQPKAYSELCSAGVWDDQSYVEREQRLSVQTRIAAGLARYRCLSGVNPSPATLLEHLGSAPPWLLNLKLDQLELTVRQRNVLRAQDLATVRDLSRLGSGGLLKLPNMGSKSVRELAVILYEVMSGERAAGQDVLSPAAGAAKYTPSSPSFAEEFVSCVSRMPQREAQLVLARSGQLEVGQSFQEAAALLHTARPESLRRVEESALSTFSQHPLCSYALELITTHLARRTKPLPLERLAEATPWFGEAPTDLALHRYFVANLTGGALHYWTLSGVLIVSRLSKKDWQRAGRSALSLREGADDHEWALKASAVASALLPTDGAELREMLIDSLRHDRIHREPSSRAESEPEVDLTARLQRELVRRQLEAQ